MFNKDLEMGACAAEWNMQGQGLIWQKSLSIPELVALQVHLPKSPLHPYPHHSLSSAHILLAVKRHEASAKAHGFC